MKGFIYISTFSFLLFLSLLPSRADAGSPAATVGNTTSHGGVITQGSSNVFIGNVSAARLGDYVTCPLVTPFPHVGGTIVTGSGSVFINGMPAARLGGTVQETGIGSPVSTVVNGNPTVVIGD